MAESKPDNFLISTPAKVFLNDWSALRTIISEHTLRVKDRAQAATDDRDMSKTTLFTDQQIRDALNGPYHPIINQKMAAYATIAKIRCKLTVEQDENLKTDKEDEDANPALATFLEKTSTNDLDTLQGQLDELTQSHDQTWQAQRAEWIEYLISTLDQHDISLTELEIKELRDEEPISELLDRFTDLKISLPKKNKSGSDYKSYYTLKTKLAISSSLGRQHKPHTDEVIDPILKKMKTSFDKIHSEEEALATQQKTETDELIQSIVKINTLLST